MSRRIGILCEGNEGFEDQQVLVHLASRVVAHNDIECLPMGSKPVLLAECGKAAKRLLETDGCCRVLIVWDLEPSFSTAAACRHNDRAKAVASLAQAGLQGHSCVFLVCIEKELETWLLADGAAIATVLHRPPHPSPRVTDSIRPGTANPKGRLRRLFNVEGRGRQYDPKTDGPRIAKELPTDFGALGKLATFRRFKSKLVEAC